jgi:hypothetical protein
VHEYITVGARDLKKYEFYVCAGCRVSITFYLPAGPDIMFRILGPDGREVYPKSKVDRLSWSFTAEKAGTYVLEFDNTYSILTGKSVDLALAVSPPPTPPTTISIPMLTLVAIVSFVAGVILTLIASRLIARRAKAQQA